MADFEVLVRGGDKAVHSGEARYLIDESNGVLTVYANDGSRVRYSPAFWESVEDSPDLSVPEVNDVDPG